MTIPFVRQLPNRRVLQEVVCSPLIEDIGRAFLARGGRYLIEVLPKLGSPNVRIVACVLDAMGKQIDVVEETVENGPKLAGAVNRVIEASIKYFDNVAQETKH